MANFLIVSLAILLTATPARAEVKAPKGLERSAFFQFVAKNDGKVPYPFRDLKSRLGDFLSTITNSTVLDKFEVADGRSLQRKNSDAVFPREVALPPGTQEITPIYVAHAERAGQLEVLSWNPASLRYDFLIVENYQEGGEPSVHPADLATCKTCHQAEGPVLSRFPWAETTFNPQVREAIRAARGAEIAKRVRDSKAAGKPETQESIGQRLFPEGTQSSPEASSRSTPPCGPAITISRPCGHAKSSAERIAPAADSCSGSRFSARIPAFQSRRL